MENVNEIVARLNQGESLEKIAAELTTILNEAQKTYETEQKLKAQVEQARAAQKREELEYIVRDAMTWLREYYSALYAEVAKDMSERDKDELFTTVVDAMLEAMDKTAEAMLNPRKSIFGMNPIMFAMMNDMPMLNPDGIVYKEKAPTNSKPKSDDDILNDFLGKICH